MPALHWTGKGLSIRKQRQIICATSFPPSINALDVKYTLPRYNPKL
jgi:hypothetical protein